MLLLNFGNVFAQSSAKPLIDGNKQVLGGNTEVYSTNYWCDNAVPPYLPSTVSWTVTNGTIVSQEGTSVTVLWNNQGVGTLSVSGSNCSYIYACCNTINVTITTPLPTTVTICGSVTTTCGEPVSGATITFSGVNISTTTDGAGLYCATIPYGSSGSVSASKSNISFTASQSFLNSTSNRTLNFSVVGNPNSSLSLTWNSPNNDYLTIGGMIPGFVYILSRTLVSNGQTANLEITTADGTLWMANKMDYSSFCIKLKCGGQAPICVY